MSETIVVEPKNHSQILVEPNTIHLTTKASTQKTAKIYEECFAKLMDSIQEDDLTISNIINVITRSIEITEKYIKLTGLEKKTMVIRMSVMAIKEANMKDEIEVSLIDFVNTAGPSLIDTIIFVSKGKLAVNVKKLKRYFYRIFKCC